MKDKAVVLKVKHRKASPAMVEVGQYFQKKYGISEEQMQEPGFFFVDRLTGRRPAAPKRK